MERKFTKISKEMVRVIYVVMDQNWRHQYKLTFSIDTHGYM